MTIQRTIADELLLAAADIVAFTNEQRSSLFERAAHYLAEMRELAGPTLPSGSLDTEKGLRSMTRRIEGFTDSQAAQAMKSAAHVIMAVQMVVAARLPSGANRQRS